MSNNRKYEASYVYKYPIGLCPCGDGKEDRSYKPNFQTPPISKKNNYLKSDNILHTAQSPIKLN